MTQDPKFLGVKVAPATNKPYQSKGNSRWYDTASIVIHYQDTSEFGGRPDVSLMPAKPDGNPCGIVINISPAAMTAIAEWWLQQEEAYK